MNDTIDSRHALWLPRIAMFGFAAHDAIARWMNSPSRSRMRVGADGAP